MKKTLLILGVLALQACSFNTGITDEDETIGWTEYSESQTQRLEENGIQYTIKDDYIYILSKDLKKASACCS